MSDDLISIKSFLGKYYPELHYSATQEKYKNTQLDTFFEQRFLIQNNKTQMIVDPGLHGLTVIITGNEIHISKNLYDHPSVLITNSLENNIKNSNPRSLYNPETFSTIAYLVCQNHTMFQIVDEVDEPIYVKYKSEYESFYNSVIIFEVSTSVEVEIVEEIESFSALNAVTNYILQPLAKISLTTFYQNHISAISFVYRNIIVQDDASYNHILLGKGSANIIDENKIHTYNRSKSELLGVINSDSRKFHSILYVQPVGENYNVNVDYRAVLSGKSDITFFPMIIGQEPAERATISISNITLEEIPTKLIEQEVTKYLGNIIERTTLDRLVGVKRFYDNKIKFFHFL